jgi:hypothetical protein
LPEVIGKARLAAAMLATFALLSSCRDQDSDGAQKFEADALPLKPGLWQTQIVFTKIEVPGLNEAKKKQIMEEAGEASTSSVCLSPKDAQQPSAKFFGGNKARKCIYQSYTVNGANVDMAMSCTMPAMATSELKLQGPVAAEGFNLRVNAALRLPMLGKVDLQGQSLGMYMGPCTAW